MIDINLKNATVDYSYGFQLSFDLPNSHWYVYEFTDGNFEKNWTFQGDTYSNNNSFDEKFRSFGEGMKEAYEQDKKWCTNHD